MAGNPVALKLRGLQGVWLAVNVPAVFPPSELLILRVIAALVDCSPPRRRHPALDDAASAKQGGANASELCPEQIRLEGRYDWDTLVLDPTVSRMVRQDFELFFEERSGFEAQPPLSRGYFFLRQPRQWKNCRESV